VIYFIAKSFQLCHRNDPKFNECLKNAIQAALIVLRDGNKKNLIDN
jgi:hypothetical protein